MATSKIFLTVEMRPYARPLLFLCVLFRLHKINWLWSKIVKLAFKTKLGNKQKLHEELS